MKRIRVVFSTISFDLCSPHQLIEDKYQMQQQLIELKPLLASPKKIVITTHHKPDADALGSSLALARFLKKLNHDVQVITPSDYPSFLDWMSGNDGVWVYNDGKEERSAAY